MKRELLILIRLIKSATHNFKRFELTTRFWPENVSNLQALVWAKTTLLMHRKVVDHQLRNIYQRQRRSSCRWHVTSRPTFLYCSDFLSCPEWSLWSQMTNEYLLTCPTLKTTVTTHCNLEGDITHEYICFLTKYAYLCIF